MYCVLYILHYVHDDAVAACHGYGRFFHVDILTVTLLHEET